MGRRCSRRGHFDIDFIGEPRDLLVRQRQIGEYFVFPTAAEAGQGNSRDIYIYSMDSDKFEKMDYETCMGEAQPNASMMSTTNRYRWRRYRALAASVPDVQHGFGCAHEGWLRHWIYRTRSPRLYADRRRHPQGPHWSLHVLPQVDCEAVQEHYPRRRYLRTLVRVRRRHWRLPRWCRPKTGLSTEQMAQRHLSRTTSSPCGFRAEGRPKVEMPQNPSGHLPATTMQSHA